ncbi:MAG: hypothetical protein EMLJLAPB_01028 [Candidatus Argoarchaeum ethanivorans]|uniref:UPF0288 protein EMLJLAPB_01028 n=1 Tax=Candidatus Argoarchaeum ethanivorans TaxID=2608793 RepID=A0A811TEQ4_9EURY|nr:MAG: hypothetical protein EMLJLAPB_01028 [Candidatus Argoarchaeum ethanivorans]
MNIQVNGVEVELPPGSTVKDAIERSGEIYHKKGVIALIKDISKVAEETDRYMIKTSKGSLKIKLQQSKLTEYWKKNYKEYEEKRLVWKTKDVLAIGHVTTDLPPQRTAQKYGQWDVFFGLSGFESSKTDLMFSTSDHTGVYGEPEGGVFAKLVGGRKILSKLTEDDTITTIIPVVERQKEAAADPIELETTLTGGERIVTCLEIDVSQGPHDDVEYALAALENRLALAIDTTYAFTGFKGIRDVTHQPENNQIRTRGSLTVRNTGLNTGQLYIYKHRQMPIKSHNVIGTITSGIELIDIAKEHQAVTMKTKPERVMVLGLTQKQAEEELKKRSITQQREGLTDDDAIVTGQEPLNTLAILNNKKLTTTGTQLSDIIKIELYYDKAPETIQYFKFICGLLEKPIGNMRTFYNHRRMGLVLFKPNAKLFNRAILRENTPVDKVDAFEIAVTNMSRKNLGMIGIRSKEDTTHGPTGEEFAATNVIGRVTGGFEALTKSKTDDLMCLQVINEPEI